MTVPTPQSEVAPGKHRIGVLFTSTGKMNLDILKYLVLQLNPRQAAFEFVLLPSLNDPLLKLLDQAALIEQTKVEEAIRGFKQRYQPAVEAEAADYDTNPEVLDGVVVISAAKLDGNYYALETDDSAVLALGAWDSVMSPPSIYEFILTMLIAESLGFSDARRELSHIGTSGCLFDFNAYLPEARYKTLTGYICDRCKSKLHSRLSIDKVASLLDVLSWEWLGKVSDPDSPAGIVKKFGFDLFRGNGIQTTFWQRARTVLESELIRNLIWISATIAVTALLFIFGLKK